MLVHILKDSNLQKIKNKNVKILFLANGLDMDG
jgi:hypothetical protein